MSKELTDKEKAAGMQKEIDEKMFIGIANDENEGPAYSFRFVILDMSTGEMKHIDDPKTYVEQEELAKEQRDFYAEMEELHLAKWLEKRKQNRKG